MSNVFDPVDLEETMLKHSETGSTCILDPDPSGEKGHDTPRLPAGAFKHPNVAERLYEPRSRGAARKGAPVVKSKRFA